MPRSRSPASFHQQAARTFDHGALCECGARGFELLTDLGDVARCASSSSRMGSQWCRQSAPEAIEHDSDVEARNAASCSSAGSATAGSDFGDQHREGCWWHVMCRHTRVGRVAPSLRLGEIRLADDPSVRAKSSSICFMASMRRVVISNQRSAVVGRARRV